MTRLVVRVVRGGKRLLNTRYHLEQAQLTEEQWRTRWQAGRRFLAADGEGSSRTPADGRSSAELGVQGLAERPSGSVPLWLGSAAALAGNYRARAEEYARMSSPRPAYDLPRFVDTLTEHGEHGEEAVRFFSVDRGDWTFLCVVTGDLSRAGRHRDQERTRGLTHPATLA